MSVDPVTAECADGGLGVAESVAALDLRVGGGQFAQVALEQRQLGGGVFGSDRRGHLAGHIVELGAHSQGGAQQGHRPAESVEVVEGGPILRDLGQGGDGLAESSYVGGGPSDAGLGVLLQQLPEGRHLAGALR